MTIRRNVFAAALIFVVSSALQAREPAQTYYVESYHEVLALFDKIGYTKENWQKGVREVPRIYLTDIPGRWQSAAHKMPVSEKKAIFFRLIGPSVLRANEIILEQRARLKTIADKKHLSDREQTWIQALAIQYKLTKMAVQGINKALMNKLIRRVDAVPASLALAQSAEESGWGTSRFAVQGNSLFGQWDFSGNGIKPNEQRQGLGNYGLAKFETPQDAVNAYILNLNTHPAYQALREKRARMRVNGEPLSGWELAKTLTKYSERREAYVDSLHRIMRVNRLQHTDSAYLWEKGDILIIPAASGSK